MNASPNRLEIPSTYSSMITNKQELTGDLMFPTRENLHRVLLPLPTSVDGGGPDTSARASSMTTTSVVSSK